MRAMIDSIFKSISDFFKKLTRGERVRLTILAVVVIVLGVTVAIILSRTSYAVLYSGLSTAEAGEIYSTLQDMGEDVQLQGTSTILVPAGRVNELKATLAATQGYNTNRFTYDFSSNISGFGMTEQQIQKQYQYELEVHVQTLLLSLNKIEACLVKLSIPEESLFSLSANRDVTRASVTLAVAGGAKLTQTEIDVIAETVIGAVPGLDAANISITDSNMNRYKIGDGADVSGDVSGQLALKKELQALLEEQAFNVTSPIFGPDAIRIQANAELNFDEVVHEIIDYEPPVDGDTEGLVVSIYNLWEAQRTEAAAQGAVGTETNGMGATEYPVGELEDGEIYEQRINETNYELDRTMTQIKEALGKPTKLSIAVTIDSNASSDDYTQSIRNLVAMATGVDERYVTIERVPFYDNSEEMQAALDAQQEYLRSMQIRELIITAAKWVLMILTGIVFLLLIRSIIRSARRPVQEPGATIDLLAGEDMTGFQEGLAYQNIDLTAKPENVENLEKLIDRDAGAVAQLLRNWLADD